MQFERKVVLIVLCTGIPYVVCAGGGLFLYTRAHPGEMIPRWISVPIFCLFVLTILLGTFLANRMARNRVRIESAEKSHLRRVRAIKGLKAGLIVWGVILLNDARMLLRRSIPAEAAIPGTAVVLLMIIVTWVSLKRLQKA